MPNKKPKQEKVKEYLFPPEEDGDELDIKDFSLPGKEDELDEDIDAEETDDLWLSEDDLDDLFSEEDLSPEGQMEQEESLDLIRFEHYLEKLEGEDEDLESELDIDYDNVYKTKHSDGHTFNAYIAWDQGLTYTPPDDPATVPSETAPWGLDLAAGFAPSMEDANPDVEDLPDEVDNNDLDLLDDIYVALHNNSETAQLTNIKVQVDQGVVSLWGTVPTEADIAIVAEVINDLDGVVDIIENLEIED